MYPATKLEHAKLTVKPLDEAVRYYNDNILKLVFGKFAAPSKEKKRSFPSFNDTCFNIK